MFEEYNISLAIWEDLYRNIQSEVLEVFSPSEDFLLSLFELSLLLIDVGNLGQL